MLKIRDYKQLDEENIVNPNKYALGMLNNKDSNIKKNLKDHKRLTFTFEDNDKVYLIISLRKIKQNIYACTILNSKDNKYSILKAIKRMMLVAKKNNFNVIITCKKELEKLYLSLGFKETNEFIKGEQILCLM